MLTAKRHVAYLPEYLNLYGNLTVVEHLQCGARLLQGIREKGVPVPMAMLKLLLDNELRTDRRHHLACVREVHQRHGVGKELFCTRNVEGRTFSLVDLKPPQGSL